MANVTIFGKGNMGQAIGQNFKDAGNDVTYITRDSSGEKLGEIVVLAVPYSSISEIIAKYKTELENKIIIDITNPVDFATFDSLVVPSDSSATAEIANQLTKSAVIKGFNTNFAATLVNKQICTSHQTTVLLAGDDKSVKDRAISALEGSGLSIIDAGSMKRARELEAMGFLQISLAGANKISWNGGFGVFE